MAFGDFADFLTSLSIRPDIYLPDVTWINLFSNLSKIASNSSENVSETQPRILHCVQRSIIQQIVALAEPHGFANHLTVMSPYFDKNGRAIKNLSELLKAKTFSIAVPPKEDQISSFPFSEAASWGIPVTAVQPSIVAPNRPLHAKWFEIQLNDGYRITATGSVNATLQSLCTTKNIETCVVRLEREDRNYVKWNTCPIPANYAPNEFFKIGIENKYVLFARVHDDGILEGEVLTKQNVSGTWDCIIERPSGESISFSVEIDKNRKFKCRISEMFGLLYQTGIQITIHRDEIHARGWLHNENILNLPKHERLSITSLIRLLNSEETTDDEIALIDYLAISANRHVSTFLRRINRGTDQRRTGSGADASIDLAEMEPVESIDHEGSTGLKVDHREVALERIFANIRRLLISKSPSARGHALQIEGDLEPDESDETESVGVAEKKVENALMRFEDCMRDIINHSVDEKSKKAALVILFEVKMHMLKRHSGDRITASRFIKSWFKTACGSVKCAKPISALEQYIFTSAAIYPILPDDKQVDGAHNEQTLTTMLHGRLEDFCGIHIDRDYAFHSLLEEFPQFGFTPWLLEAGDPDLKKNLELILNSNTSRNEISKVTAAYETGNCLPDSPILSSTQTGKLFLKHLNRVPNSQPRPYKNADPANYICVHCHMRFPSIAENELRERMIAFCERCGKFTIKV